ncbi:MAG: hypothetical protein R3B89_03425 [Polyangiaceae bacterium]
MGWLRDMMQRGDPPSRSFGDLARRCLAHPSWPAEPRPKPRSLATLFSRLDRELDLDWLRDRPAVQSTMAEVLGAPVADVQMQCQPAFQGFGAPSEASVRFEDIPFARSLRLKEEPLPPGIPLLPQRVPAWDRVWWFAPSGAGRSLVGRWLEARGAARWVVARDWPSAEPETREAGPVFVELHSPTGSEPLRRRPPRSKICVAADFLPETSDWTVVRSLPLAAYMTELVAWVSERLPSDSRLQADTAVAWLGGLPSDRGVLTTLGAALGLLGLMDEIGHSQIRGRSLNQLARAAIKFRVAKLAGDHRLLKEQGFEILVGIHQQCLTETNQPAELPRSEDDWLSVVPPELSRGVDVEWVKLSLQRAGAPVTVRELERAARQLPPGAYRIVRALTAGGLLRSLEPGTQLALGPVWLVNVARSAALRQLLARPAHEWGEALLTPGSALLVLEALQERLEQDPDPLVDGVLELEARDSPAYAAAVETLVRLIGLDPDLLRELSPELARSLYAEQLELAVEVPNGPPLPRLEHPEELVARAPLLSRGAWFVALWALAERAPAREGARSEWLQPWETDARQPLSAALDAVETWLEQGPSGHAEELLLRLFERRGVSGAAPHALERPALCLNAFRAGTLELDALEPWSSELFLRTWRALDADERPRFANQIVERWTLGGRPESGQRWLATGSDPAPSIWPLLGRDTLLAAIAGGADFGVPWALLSREQWRWVAEFWQLSLPPLEAHEAVQARLVMDQEQMLERIPGETVAELLALGSSARAWPRSVLERAWRTDPGRSSNNLETRLGQAGRGDPSARLMATLDALWLLDSQPADVAGREGLEQLLEHLRILEQEPELLAEVVRFLQGRIARRGAAWRFAYELLDGVETRRQRLARHAPLQP